MAQVWVGIPGMEAKERSEGCTTADTSNIDNLAACTDTVPSVESGLWKAVCIFLAWMETRFVNGFWKGGCIYSYLHLGSARCCYGMV